MSLSSQREGAYACTFRHGFRTLRSTAQLLRLFRNFVYVSIHNSIFDSCTRDAINSTALEIYLIEFTVGFWNSVCRRCCMLRYDSNTSINGLVSGFVLTTCLLYTTLRCWRADADVVKAIVPNNDWNVESLFWIDKKQFHKIMHFNYNLFAYSPATSCEYITHMNTYQIGRHVVVLRIPFQRIVCRNSLLFDLSIGETTPSHRSTPSDFPVVYSMTRQ